MANVLLDFLRQAAMGIGADKVREYAEPAIRGAIDEYNRPSQPMTEGYRYDEQGFPTYSTGYEAVTTPYSPSGIAGVEGATLSDEQLMNVLNETARDQTYNFVRDNTVSEPIGFEPIDVEDITTPEDLMQKIDPERMKAQGITPQEGYRMAQAAAHLNLVPEYTRVAEETGNDSILDSVGNFFSELFGNEQKMLALAAGFNNLTYRPNEKFNEYAYKRIAELKEEPKRNATIAALRKKGMGSIADYIEQTKDVKGGMKMALEQGQYVTGSGAEIQQKFGITGLDPKKPYRYNKMTGKVEAVGGGGVTVSTGGDALAKAIYGDIGAQRKTFVEEGIASRGRLDAYNRIGNLLKSTDQGRFAQTKQDVRKILETVGLGGAIDLDQYQNATELQAATNQLVAEELRANKGPQTDFDARFAQSYIPNIQNPAEANKAMVKFGQSKAEGQAVFGKIANKLRSSDPNVEEQMANLNDLALSFNNVIFAPNGTPLYFVDWVNANRGADPLELMTEWVKKVNQSQMGM